MGRSNGWLKVNALERGRVEVLMFGEIGWEVTASELVSELSGVEADEISVRINSPGGDAYEGLAIMNALRHHAGRVTTVVEGLAASAASVVAIGGGDRLVMRPGSELMLHDAWAFSQGNAHDMTKTAADLNRVSDTIAGIYADKAGTDREMWRAAMHDESWFTAEEAVEAGLADAIEDAREGKKALAGTFNLAGFKHAGRAGAPAPQISDANRAAEKGGNMSFLDEVARKLGVHDKLDEAGVMSALDQVLAEQVAEVTVTTEVAYPEEVEVVPTGKVSVAPTGVVPEGLTFTVGEVPEGWSAEVNETTGEMTVVAPDGGAVGDAAEIVLTVAGGEGEPSEFTVTATIVSAGGDETVGSDPASPAGDETVTLDRGVYDALMARAARGDEADSREADQRAEALVSAAIKQGKVLAAKKSALVARAKEDYSAMETYFASLTSGTIPVAEKGRGGSDERSTDDSDSERADRLARGKNSLGIR